MVPEIVINNQTISDPQVIANKFNFYVANVGSNLAKTTSPTTKNFNDFLPVSNRDYVCVQIDENEIHHTVYLLKNSYSKGHDDLSTVILKNCANELS